MRPLLIYEQFRPFLLENRGTHFFNALNHPHMTTAFNRYATQGNQFVAQLANELDMPQNQAHSMRILRSVLHGIRNRITPAASTHLMAQLPMAVKAIYVDGWDAGFPQKRVFDYEDFIDEVYRSCGYSRSQTLVRKAEVENSVIAVFKVLKKNVSDGEYADVMSYMPVALRLTLIDYMMEGESFIH